jgi:Lrp/AsnC family transcriptional regulator
MTDLAAHVLEPNRRLDAIDRKILMVLQEDASLSVAEIGDRVGLSSTPCWKRIQRLEADGVILRRVALVDQNKIGLGISVFVSVESADHSEAWLRTFADAVSAMPEVMEFYRMAGDVDYMLRVVVADMQSYDVFYKKLIGAVPLKNVTSRFAMEKIKSVTALPIPAVDRHHPTGVSVLALQCGCDGARRRRPVTRAWENSPAISLVPIFRSEWGGHTTSRLLGGRPGSTPRLCCSRALARSPRCRCRFLPAPRLWLLPFHRGGVPSKFSRPPLRPTPRSSEPPPLRPCLWSDPTIMKA